MSGSRGKILEYLNLNPANADQVCPHRNSSKSSRLPMVNPAITTSYMVQAPLGIIGTVMTVMNETGIETLCLQQTPSLSLPLPRLRLQASRDLRHTTQPNLALVRGTVQSMVTIREVEEMEETPLCQPLNLYVHSPDVLLAAGTWSEVEVGTLAAQTHGPALQARVRATHSRIWRTRANAN
jgi:hypothetical protein